MQLGWEHQEVNPRLVAVRTTLSATAAELRGDWDEVEFLCATVCLLPDPHEVAWAAMFLARTNLQMINPAPDPADIAAAGQATTWRYAQDGSSAVSAMLLATAARSLDQREGAAHGDLLVAAAGPLLAEAPQPSTKTAMGLFSAVSYSFVRAALAVSGDPEAAVERLLGDLS